MVGVRQFDEGAVLDTAVDVFWRNGFCATAMADLAEASGVQRGSLYHAYGGKQELLLRALDRYSERFGGAARAALADPDPRQAIEAFLESHLARMTDPVNPAGCLLCQTTLECGGRNPVISDRIRRHFERTETALRETLARAQSAGLLTADADPGALARFFLGTSRGMAVLHRAYGELQPVRDMAKTAVAVLDCGPAAREPEKGEHG